MIGGLFGKRSGTLEENFADEITVRWYLSLYGGTSLKNTNIYTHTHPSTYSTVYQVVACFFFTSGC